MSKKRNPFLWGVCLIGLAAIASSADQKPAWKGTISKEGDVVVVKNPKTPLYGSDVLKIEEDLSVGGENPAYVLGTIWSFAVNDEGTIFILDGKEMNVKVFGRDGKFLRIIGREGQGPGEIHMANRVFCPDNATLAVVMMDRLSYFKSTGEPVKDVSLASLSPSELRPAAMGGFFGYFIVRDNTNPRYELRRLDGSLKTLFAIESSPTPNSLRDGFDPVFPIVRWGKLSGDRVVCGYAVKYEIRIHDARGRVERKILLDPDRVSFTNEDLEERTKDVPAAIKAKLNVPKYFPSFRTLVTDDEDKIYVATFERLGAGKKGCYCDVYDKEGKYLAKVILPAASALIQKGYLYCSDETEDGLAVLKRYRIKWMN
jgi:hypothetical protein